MKLNKIFIAVDVSLPAEEMAWTQMLSSDYKQQCLVKMSECAF